MLALSLQYWFLTFSSFYKDLKSTCGVVSLSK